MLRPIGLNVLVATAFFAFFGATMAVSDDASKSNVGAFVYIISPLDGATVTSPVTIQFGLEGMGVAPAGVEKSGTGHHHLIVDAPLPALNEPIPADGNHRHFGGGQTQTTIELAPGTHSLQLLLADHYHIPHNPPVHSNIVTIEVR